MRAKNEDTKIRIYEYINEYIKNNRISPTINEIAKNAGCAVSTAYKFLERLKDEGLIHTAGRGRITSSVNNWEMGYAPILGIVACGKPKLAVEDIQGYLPLNMDYFGKGEYFLLVASGESMINADSLSGTPCIYLAKSSYTCWLELNRPEENKFFVSAFKLKGTKRFLDLTCLTWEKLEDGRGDKNDIKAKLCTFPLIIATSFLVDENTGRAFHSEYIISELLMNVIAVSDKYDGVAYFSKKFSDKKKYYPINICFALLAKFNGEKYTSDIEDFEWTNPMSLREYSMINWTARIKKLIINGGSAKDDETIVKNPPFTLIGEDVAYSDTLMHDFDEWIIEKNGL